MRLRQAAGVRRGEWTGCLWMNKRTGRVDGLSVVSKKTGTDCTRYECAALS